MTQNQSKDSQESSLKGQSQGVPDDQTPAIKHPGQYTADNLEQENKDTQGSEAKKGSAAEGSHNQGTGS